MQEDKGPGLHSIFVNISGHVVLFLDHQTPTKINCAALMRFITCDPNQHRRTFTADTPPPVLMSINESFVNYWSIFSFHVEVVTL